MEEIKKETELTEEQLKEVSGGREVPKMADDDAKDVVAPEAEDVNATIIV